MRSGSKIRALLIFFPVLVAVIFVGGFATSDAQEGAPLPVVQQQSLLPDDLTFSMMAVSSKGTPLEALRDTNTGTCSFRR